MHVRTLPRYKQCDDRGKDDCQHPYVKTFSTRLAAPSSPSSAPAMVRETSGSQPSTRRLTAGKRNSIGSPGHGLDQPTPHQFEDFSSDSVDEEPQSSLTQLQSQLEQVKRDIDLVEADVSKEDEEFAIAHEQLKHEKEAKASKLEERNEASKHLKTQINQHEGKKSSLNKERSRKEALVAQKEREQKGKRDDITRWDEQTRNHKRHLEQLEIERLAIIADFENQIQDARANIEKEEVEVEAIGAANEETKHQLKIWSRKGNANNDGHADESTEMEVRQQKNDMSWQTKVHEWGATQAAVSREIAIVSFPRRIFVKAF